MYKDMQVQVDIKSAPIDFFNIAFVSLKLNQWGIRRIYNISNLIRVINRLELRQRKFRLKNTNDRRTLRCHRHKSSNRERTNLVRIQFACERDRNLVSLLRGHPLKSFWLQSRNHIPLHLPN